MDHPKVEEMLLYMTERVLSKGDGPLEALSGDTGSERLQPRTVSSREDYVERREGPTSSGPTV